LKVYHHVHKVSQNTSNIVENNEDDG